MTYTCTVCQTTKTEPIAKTTKHVWDDGRVTKEPTCKETGVKTYTCIVCGQTGSEVIAKTSHNWDDGKVTTKPTCKDEGVKTYTCSICGETKTETIAKLDHTWDEGKVTKEPTTEAEGEKTYTCTVCGTTKTEAIAKLPVCDGGENCPSRKKFKDVDTARWYHLAVDFALTEGLFAGTSDNTFEPNSPMTRAMMVAVLWRAAGYPEAKSASGFTDVPAASYYAKAVDWAKENSIVAGTTDTTFSPNEHITREQMAAILYRYARFCGKDISNGADLSQFPDADKASNYAKDALSWSVENGIISGTLENGKTYLDPKGDATRAQVAAVLMRYLKNFG